MLKEYIITAGVPEEKLNKLFLLLAISVVHLQIPLNDYSIE